MQKKKKKKKKKNFQINLYYSICHIHLFVMDKENLTSYHWYYSYYYTTLHIIGDGDLLSVCIYMWRRYLDKEEAEQTLKLKLN